MRVAFGRGLVVEASGAAALAAFLTGKVSISVHKSHCLNFSFSFDSLKLEDKLGRDNLTDKNIVAVITGSNVSPSEFVNIM